MAGILWRAASAISWSRLLSKSWLAATTSAPTRRSTNVAKAGSKSRSLRGFHDNDLLPEHARRRKRVVQHLLAHHSSYIGKIADGCRSGDHLAQKLEPLCGQLSSEEGHSGDVAARPVEAGDQAQPHRIGAEHEDDWYRRGGGLCRERWSGAAACDDQGHLTASQIGRQFRQPIGLIVRPAIFDRHILALDVAGLFQPMAECGQLLRIRIGEGRVQEPDHRHRGLLRARRER
jgi:hypothetical protein